MEKLLVTGGARSGKSTFAENWVRGLPDPGQVTYVATARSVPGDAEWAERVSHHRERRPSSWRTRETTEVAALLREAGGTVIIDCLTLWLTALLDDAGAWRETGAPSDRELTEMIDAATTELVDAWRESGARIVAVTNEVGSGIVPATMSGRLFRDLLGSLNQRVAAEADRVVLCVAGRALDLPAVEAVATAPEAHVRPPSASATGVSAPVDSDSERRAGELVDGLAKPPGSLGRLEEIGVWLAARQRRVPPVMPPRVGVTVIAGDHGIAADTSAYPPAVTAAMVRTVHSGKAAINALAAEHGATVRVRDLGVDADLTDLGADVSEYKVRRGTGRIDVEDAMSPEEARMAVTAGRALADEEIDAARPAGLLVAGDLGIGNTTIAAALTGAVLGLDAEKVTGRGTGVDDATLRRKREIVAAAIERGRPVRDDPVALTAAIGGPDFAAMAGFLAGAAERGVPVLLDGVVVTAAGLIAQLLTPGAATWWLAGHRSVEPAHTALLDHLGLEPVVDLRMRLGEGTGAVAALPTVRSAVAVCGRMAALADLDLG